MGLQLTCYLQANYKKITCNLQAIFLGLKIKEEGFGDQTEKARQ
jgi:hypothetical protein